MYASYTKIYCSSVDNHPKLTKISENGFKKNGFWAIKATVNNFFHFFVTV